MNDIPLDITKLITQYLSCKEAGEFVDILIYLDHISDKYDQRSIDECMLDMKKMFYKIYLQ